MMRWSHSAKASGPGHRRGRDLSSTLSLTENLL